MGFYGSNDLTNGVCLEQGADDLHVVQQMPLPPYLFHKIQIGLTFLVPAYLGCPEKEAVKWIYLSYKILF